MTFNEHGFNEWWESVRADECYKPGIDIAREAWRACAEDMAPMRVYVTTLESKNAELQKQVLDLTEEVADLSRRLEEDKGFYNKLYKESVTLTHKKDARISELIAQHDESYGKLLKHRDSLLDELGDRDAEIEKLTRRVAELERPVNPPDPPEPRRRDIRREFAALQIFCALIISGRSSDLNICGADTIAREFLEYMDKEVHNEHV